MQSITYTTRHIATSGRPFIATIRYRAATKGSGLNKKKGPRQ
jgi:hypothetical protein